MPRAIRGKNPISTVSLLAHSTCPITHATQSKRSRKLICTVLVLGVLVQCDASIKSIIVSIDNENNHDYIIEVLDDQNIVVKETMVQVLKIKLEERLKNTTQRVESDSEG